jgi:uncharacterized protein YhaN
MSAYVIWMPIVISVSVVIGGLLINAFLAGKAFEKKVDKDYFDKIVNTKLDLKVYEQHCKETKEKFDKIQESQAKYIESNNQLLQELVKQNAEIRTDINWIKRNLK